MSDTIAANRLNHRFRPGADVRIISRRMTGTVVTVNPSGTYGVRIGSGRAGQIIECRPVELVGVAAPGPVTFRHNRDRVEVDRLIESGRF